MNVFTNVLISHNIIIPCFYLPYLHVLNSALFLPSTHAFSFSINAIFMICIIGLVCIQDCTIRLFPTSQMFPCLQIASPLLIKTITCLPLRPRPLPKAIIFIISETTIVVADNIHDSPIIINLWCTLNRDIIILLQANMFKNVS